MVANQGLMWPVDDAQRGTVTFDPVTGMLEITVSENAEVCAVATGTVSLVAGDWLQISCGQRLVIYESVQHIRVAAGQGVSLGDVIAETGADARIKLMILDAIDPTSLFAPPASLVDTDEVPAAEPAPAIYLAPTLDGLRLRVAPVDGEPVGQIDTQDRVQSLESAEETARKLGVKDEWLKIRLDDGREVYTAAWLLVAAPAPDDTPVRLGPASSLLGMNLDLHHPQGHPDPAAMAGIGWLRLKFNVSYNPDDKSYGNKDIDTAYQRYLPLIEQYARAGMRLLLVFTHQLYGEGAGFDWQKMDGGRWRQLVPTYATFASEVAKRFKGSGLVHAYQIWNEQDTKPENARAAVPVPAEHYGYMLGETIQAIRRVDETTPIISGGHTSGPLMGARYALETLANMPHNIRPDGIAFHPYGRGVAGHRFSNWGALADEIEAYRMVLPDKPLWITEWGIQDHQGREDVIDDICDYCQGFIGILKEDYPGRVAAAIWYAWADGMDNGFGLVDFNGKPKTRIYEDWRGLG